MDRVAPGEARLHEINAAFGIQSAASTEVTIVAVILPPATQQPPGTLLQPVVGVVVGGTMIGGASSTRHGKKTKCQRGKDKVEKL